MIDLKPMETLYQTGIGDELPLPATLRELVGQLRMPLRPEDGAYVYGNFVATLDGVVSLSEQNMAGGGEISGYNRHDQMLMGVLRAMADAVVVGAGTLRAVPRHIWTAEHVFPALQAEYLELRRAMGKTASPLNVIVTGRGDVDFRLPVFSSGKVPALVVTTEDGMKRLQGHTVPESVRVVAVPRLGDLLASEVLDAIQEVSPASHVLVEGGPHLMGAFLAEEELDELFLTLAPQVAGRLEESYRPGLVEGVLFAPHRPLWASLMDVRRAESHLFLRYSFRGA